MGLRIKVRNDTFEKFGLSGAASALNFGLLFLQEKSDSGDERETKRQFGVLREFLYFCSPKQKVVDP